MQKLCFHCLCNGELIGKEELSLVECLNGCHDELVFDTDSILKVKTVNRQTYETC